MSRNWPTRTLNVCIFTYIYGCFVWSCNGAIELTAVSLFLDANSKITTWVQHKEYLQKLLAVCIPPESAYAVSKIVSKIEPFCQSSAIAPTVKSNFWLFLKLIFLNSVSDFKNNHMACYLYTFNESEDHYMKAIS